VTRAAAPDPTAKGEDWSSVELTPLQQLAEPVTLERMRKEARLRGMPLLTRGRLSVVPVTEGQFLRVVELGKTELKGAVRPATSNSQKPPR